MIVSKIKVHLFQKRSSSGSIRWNIMGVHSNLSHSIHVWYIYLHLVDSYGKLVGKFVAKYNSPMDRDLP